MGTPTQLHQTITKRGLLALLFCVNSGAKWKILWGSDPLLKFFLQLFLHCLNICFDAVVVDDGALGEQESGWGLGVFVVPGPFGDGGDYFRGWDKWHQVSEVNKSDGSPDGFVV